MATAFSSYLEAAVPQHANQFDWSPALPTKRPLSELYYSSYGESEVTPTPKPRKTLRRYSRSGFSCGPSSPTFYSTPPSAQVPQDSSMEDSGWESDEVYDQFDLGDFTKEEIKAYESMVGPGERLRDAAPPEKSLAEMLETSYQTNPTSSSQHTKGSASVTELPKELYELVRAGVSNAVEYLFSESIINRNDWAAESLESIIMDEISGPYPQINDLIRNHEFVFSLSGTPKWDGKVTYMAGRPCGSLASAQRQYEQDVYDFSRDMGLTMDSAEKWVLKAREYWSENSMDPEESDDVSNLDEKLDLPLRVSSSEALGLPIAPVEQSDQAPRDITSRGFQATLSPEARGTSVFDVSQASNFSGDLTPNSKEEIEDVVQLTTENEFKGAKRLQQRQLQNSKDPDYGFEDDRNMPATLGDPIPSGEFFLDNVIDYDGEVNRIKAVIKEKKEKAAKKTVRNARKAKLKAGKKATRQAEKDSRQEGMYEHVDHLGGQWETTKTRENLSQFEQLEDKDKPQQQKRKGQKRKRDRELLNQSEVESGEHHKHKRGRMNSDAQDAHPRKPKAKKGGPQCSPFFQPSSDPTGKKKDAGKEAEQQMDFQPPMIQQPPADLPSTPVKEGIHMVLISPPSDDSSPLSSIRSTPSLPSFNSKEVQRDNERIRQLSHKCPQSKLVASTRRLPDDSTGLPTPASSPISLRDLNKRILEGTIYQDGIVLAKPGAPASLTVPKKARKRSTTVSRFFAKLPSKKPKSSDKVSCIPFPPLHATSFGLVQERLSHDPFRLLIAVIFLNKTRGSVALPVFYQLMDRYPTPADLAAAKQEDVVEIIQHLGLQNQRAKKCINLAQAWLERPPEKGKRYRVLHYPKRNDGKDIRPDEIVHEEDGRVAWEIGQLPGIGVYAIDSWRIFCRDQLRGLPSGLPNELTTETQKEELQKEWTRVLAGDKELRAYLRWRWLRNGWDWDPVTGERREADASELAKADKGGVIYEGDDGDMVVGNAKIEGSEVVKAEVETGAEAGRESREADDAVTVTRSEHAPRGESGDAEGLTAAPQHDHDIDKEQKDSKAAKEEPESAATSELDRSGSSQEP